MNTKSFLIAAVITLSTAFSGCAIAQSSNGNDTFRVGTYNVRLSAGDKGTPNAWANRKDDIVVFMENLNLDVFGLQEVRPDQAKHFDNAFKDYQKFGEHRAADRVSDEASPIYFRTNIFECIKGGTFWLSETPDIPGSKSWKTACPRICSWAILKNRKNGKVFCFANTHTDHRSALARKEGMLLVIKRMKDFAPAGTPIVFTGDHNCRETDEPAQAVSKILVNALYASKKQPEGPWRTFSGWKVDNEISTAEALKFPRKERNANVSADGKVKFGPRIDYIYVSPSIKVLTYKTHADLRPGTKLYHSDHHPVTAEIEL